MGLDRARAGAVLTAGAPTALALPHLEAGRRPALDGLRGLAIGLVLLTHAAPALHVGWLGVDLFFALSGFLITGILLRSTGRSDYWTRFVSRRARRIVPLYAVVLGVVGLVRWAGLDSAPAAPWWVYAGFLTNYWVALAGTFGSALLAPTWSLAVEEQFYAAWPFVVRWFSRSGLALLCGALLVVAPILRWVLLGKADAIYVLTPCRVDSLAAGALAAILADWPGCRRLAMAAMVAGAAGALAASSSSAASQVVGYSSVAIGFAGLVSRSAELDRGPLTVAPLRWLGRVSYCAYLVHPLLFHVVGPVAGIPATLLVAELSWRFLERPLLGPR